MPSPKPPAPPTIKPRAPLRPPPRKSRPRRSPIPAPDHSVTADFTFAPKEEPTGRRNFRTVTFGDLATLLESFDGPDGASRQLELVELAENFSALNGIDRQLVIDTVARFRMLADKAIELDRLKVQLLSR